MHSVSIQGAPFGAREGGGQCKPQPGAAPLLDAAFPCEVPVLCGLAVQGLRSPHRGCLTRGCHPSPESTHSHWSLAPRPCSAPATPPPSGTHPHDPPALGGPAFRKAECRWAPPTHTAPHPAVHTATAWPDVLVSGRLRTLCPLSSSAPPFSPRSWHQCPCNLPLRSLTPSFQATSSPPPPLNSRVTACTFSSPRTTTRPESSFQAPQLRPPPIVPLPLPGHSHPTLPCCNHHLSLWPHPCGTVRGLPRGLTALLTALTLRTSTTTVLPFSSIFLPFLSCHLGGKTLTQLLAYSAHSLCH